MLKPGNYQKNGHAKRAAYTDTSSTRLICVNFNRNVCKYGLKCNFRHYVVYVVYAKAHTPNPCAGDMEAIMEAIEAALDMKPIEPLNQVLVRVLGSYQYKLK